MRVANTTIAENKHIPEDKLFRINHVLICYQSKVGCCGEKKNKYFKTRFLFQASLMILGCQCCSQHVCRFFFSLWFFKTILHNLLINSTALAKLTHHRPLVGDVLCQSTQDLLHCTVGITKLRFPGQVQPAKPFLQAADTLLSIT